MNTYMKIKSPVPVDGFQPSAYTTAGAVVPKASAVATPIPKDTSWSQQLKGIYNDAVKELKAMELGTTSFIVIGVSVVGAVVLMFLPKRKKR